MKLALSAKRPASLIEQSKMSLQRQSWHYTRKSADKKKAPNGAKTINEVIITCINKII